MLKVIIYSNTLFQRSICGVDISPSFRKYSMSVLLLCQPNSVQLLDLPTYVTLCMRLVHEGLDEVQVRWLIFVILLKYRMATIHIGKVYNLGVAFRLLSQVSYPPY